MNFRTVSRKALLTSASTARHIELQNIPSSVTPADIRRLLFRSKVKDVQDVSIIYRRFMPTGRALLALNEPSYTNDNLRALENASFAGVRIQSEAKVETAPRKNYVERIGDGPHGNTWNGGKNVFIWNLHPSTPTATIRSLLEGFELASVEDSLLKLSYSRAATSSGFLVRLSTESEAQRVVRTLHMTDLEPEKYGPAHPIRAHVVF
ncbi:hypothetical protein D9758_003262 [Tetrapyrgos nigripes]|uniref:RRM domain-containing protein n=1 Tax=Tetrapyrgos nigripes TaxID=182062 RepID=A0A8H5GJ99_9AGAR|nr:hypothetical protein D9758_003262 [Tetrapyrgos nigripes]